MSPEAEEPKTGGCLKKFGIGCLVVLVIAVVGGFLAYKGARKFIGNMVEQYTDTAPATLPVVSAAPGEAEAVAKRVKNFSEAFKKGESTGPLVLSAQDINVLIANDPDYASLAGKVHVTIENSQIRGQFSVPLDKLGKELGGELGKIVKGRYLNGTGVFQAEMTAGRLTVFVDSVEVRGKQLPEPIMRKLKSKNLAEDANSDPESAAFLQKLQSISVKDGKIHIVPK